MFVCQKIERVFSIRAYATYTVAKYIIQKNHNIKFQQREVLVKAKS
jgi:hypothetical protein